MSVPLREQDHGSPAAGVAGRIGGCETLETASGPSPAPAAPNDAPASISQQRLWFLNQFQTGRSLWTVVRALRLRGQLDVPRLRGTINQLPLRHSMLRTAFHAP